jgi:hypothetical protein
METCVLSVSDLVRGARKKLAYVAEIRKDAQFCPGFHQAVMEEGKKW